KIVSELGNKVSGKDEVVVDEVPINSEQRVYYILYKDSGFISGVTDDKNRNTGVDLLEEVMERVFPICRLEYNSLSIILYTNDMDKQYKKVLDKLKKGISHIDN